MDIATSTQEFKNLLTYCTQIFNIIHLFGKCVYITPTMATSCIVSLMMECIFHWHYVPIPLDKRQKMIWNSMNGWSPNNWQPSTRIQFLSQMYKLLKLLYLPYPFWICFYGLDFASKIFNICYQVCYWNTIFLNNRWFLPIF